MKILVSGSSGFLGRNLIKALKISGHEIITIKVFHQNIKSIAIQRQYLNLELRKLGSQIGDIDIFIHLAWMDKEHWNSLFHLKVNLLLSEYLIKFLALRGVNHVVVSGTCLEYGVLEGELNERMEVQPKNAYALAKYILCKRLMAMAEEHEFELSWLRIFYVYGLDQPQNTIYGSLYKHVMSGGREFEMSLGQQVRDYLHIDQICEKIKLIISSKKGFGIVNVSSGIGITLEMHVRNWLFEINPELAVKLHLGTLPYRENEPFMFWGNTNKFQLLTDLT